MYVVVKSFRDLKNEGYIYLVGDKYPVSGKPTKARIEELSSTANASGEVLIKEVLTSKSAE